MCFKRKSAGCQCMFCLVLLGVLSATLIGSAFPSPITWVHLSSANGDLPVPNIGTEQTASLMLDIDKNGTNDFVIAERTSGTPSVVWYRRGANGWTQYLIDNTHLHIEAGGAAYDIDEDGDLDIVFGGDYVSNSVWWWENPYPNYGPSTTWTRREIKSSGSNRHHDQMFGDFDGDGKAELVFWNQGAGRLFIAEIPADPKNTQPWPFTQIYTWSGADHEGMAKADIDGDGKIDIVGGGRWFKHNGGTSYTANVIDSSQSYGRAAAGQLKEGGRPEVVFVPGDGIGRLRWYEWTGSSWIGHDLLGFDVDHGHSLEVADVNRDGHLDIFCGEMRLNGGNADAKMWLFTGDGNGSFTTEEIATGYGNHESRVGDLDGDADIDILGKPYNWNTPRVDIWLNGGTSLLSLDNWHYIQVDNSRAQRYFGLAMGDLSGDGLQDIASGRYFYRNPGGDMEGAWSRTDLGLNVDAMLITDIDDDVYGDVIAESLPNVYWFEANNAQGSSWTHYTIGQVPATSHVNGQGYALAQLEAGGKPETILSSGDGIYYFEIPATNPEAGNWPKVHITSQASEEGIGVGDIDNDGDLDISAGITDPGGQYSHIHWFENPGDGSGNWPHYEIGTTPSWADRFAVAEINGDGYLDIIVSEETSSSNAHVYWFENPGTPTNPDWTRHTVVTQYTTNSMDVADMDNDGDIDIISGEHRGTETVAIWENDGSGHFTEHVVSQGKESHLGARVADLDGDGDLDILSIAWDAYQYLHLWRNDAAAPNGDGDGDSDGDGLPDDWELEHGLDPNDATGDNGADGDPDGDALANSDEYNYGTHPNDPDTDNDGLTDGDEVNTYDTNPTSHDSDRDNIKDNDEVRDLDPDVLGVQNPFDPLARDSTGDDGQGTPDGRRDGWNDWDGDGMANAYEFWFGTDPLDPASWTEVLTLTMTGIATLVLLLLVVATRAKKHQTKTAA
jgi:hypothetical protein